MVKAYVEGNVGPLLHVEAGVGLADFADDDPVCSLLLGFLRKV